MSFYYNPGSPNNPYATGFMNCGSVQSSGASQLTGPRVSSLSRPSSVSPSTSQAYPVYMTSRARFNASRGFDAEDDLEFCPALVVDRSPASSSSDGEKSPQSPPSTLHSSPYQTSSANSSPQQLTTGVARVKKAIQIVNPATGMSVDNPRK